MQYRARQLGKLVKEYGCLDVLPYELVLKVLDHIEIAADGSVSVAFLAGFSIHQKMADFKR